MQSGHVIKEPLAGLLLGAPTCQTRPNHGSEYTAVGVGAVWPTTDAQVRLVFQGIRRTLGSAPDQKNAAITAEVRAVVLRR